MDRLKLFRSIGLFVFTSLLATSGQMANGDQNYPVEYGSRYAPCADGVCVPQAASFGYTPQQWRRWPGDSHSPDSTPWRRNQQPIDAPPQLPPGRSDETSPSPRTPLSHIPAENQNNLPFLAADTLEIEDDSLERTDQGTISPLTSTPPLAPIYPSTGYHHREESYLDLEGENYSTTYEEGLGSRPASYSQNFEGEEWNPTPPVNQPGYNDLRAGRPHRTSSLQSPTGRGNPLR